LVKAVRNILRCIGSKTRIAKKIIKMFPEHSVYVEPFGGTAAVLLNKPPCRLEVYNDINEHVYTFFKVLREKPEELIKRLEFMPFSRKLFEELKIKFRNQDFEDETEHAAVFFYLTNNSILGRMNSLRVLKKSSSGNPAKQFKNKIKEIKKVSERLRDVVIENLDYSEVIRKYDSAETLFYCDPPYLVEGGYYGKFTLADHYYLARLLSSIKGYAVVSAYPSEFLTKLYPRSEWRYYYLPAKKQNKAPSVELILTNYDPSGRCKR